MKMKYVGFLRGINVGGHHKLPMSDLKMELEVLGCSNIITILNSGNIIFDFHDQDCSTLEDLISDQLRDKFGFPVPTIIRTADEIKNLFRDEPFKNEVITKDIRRYISFAKDTIDVELSVPWSSEDLSYRILEIREKMMLSILDLSISGTPEAMASLEKMFGSEITTRNWNTIERICKKLD